MTDLFIGDGDFVVLARRVDDVVSQLGTVDMSSSLEGTTSSMIGARSISATGYAGESVDTRIGATSRVLDVLAEDVENAGKSFEATESDVTGQINAVNNAAYARIAAIMEGGVTGAVME